MRVPHFHRREVITELPIVATAISSLAPEKHLMSHTSIETAKAYEWMNYLSGTLYAGGFGHSWLERWSTSKDPANLDAIRAKALNTILEAYPYIEERLSRVHAMGDSFTAVDPFLYVSTMG